MIKTTKKNKIIKIIVIVLMCIIILPFVLWGVVRSITFLAVNTKNGIDEGIYIEINGQKQYISIRGNDMSNKVILWLHGGPTSPDGFVSYEFSQYLVDDYIIVSWDQRGCGRTYFNNEDIDQNNETASFENALDDLDKLVDYLSERFNQQKVIIVGHSYGTLLGSNYAINHPEKVFAYIGVGQVVSMESDLYAYEDAKKLAVSNGKDTLDMDRAYNEVLKNWDMGSFMKLRKYVEPYHKQDKIANTLWLGFKSPYMGIDDLKWFIKQLGSMEEYFALNKQLFDYILAVNVEDYGIEYQVPVGFISGSQDWTTPVKFARDYYDMIKAPYKEFHTIEGCGHTPQLEDSKNFARVLKVILLNSGRAN